MQKAKNRDNNLSYELRELNCNVHITPLEKQSCVSVVQKYTAQIGYKMGPKTLNIHKLLIANLRRSNSMSCFIFYIISCCAVFCNPVRNKV